MELFSEKNEKQFMKKKFIYFCLRIYKNACEKEFYSIMKTAFC